ncbi:MAG TPA: hypothetical protein DCQ67_01590 [Acidimicrobiaceae bacterium]|nr:hypothetical protein [Acidimicrobiaceae bacterium]
MLKRVMVGQGLSWDQCFYQHEGPAWDRSNETLETNPPARIQSQSGAGGSLGDMTTAELVQKFYVHANHIT